VRRGASPIGKPAHLRSQHLHRFGVGRARSGVDVVEPVLLRAHGLDLVDVVVEDVGLVYVAADDQGAKPTRLIEEAGSPSDLSRILLKDGKRLGDLGRTGGIALEIAANENSEQRLLELELSELEAHWEQEEELAAIIDGELTPLPLLESLRRRVAGQA